MADTVADDLLADAQLLLGRYIGTGDTSEESRSEVVLKYITSVSPKTPGGQIAVGGAGGCLAGYLFAKISKTAAFTVGTTLLGIQLAQYYGYVKVDWKKIHKSLRYRGTEFVKRRRATELDQKSIIDFVNQNLPLSGGFAGGLLIGMAMS